MPSHNPYLWQEAVSFAARMHIGQVRKDGKTPYCAHPFRVAMTVREVFGCEDEAAICAALLHDVIEDTPADYDDVLERFGEVVADAVAAMTKDMRLREDIREPKYDRGLLEGGWRGRLIKLADVHDNLCDLSAMHKLDGMIERAQRAISITEEAGDDHPAILQGVEKVREVIAARTREST